MEKWKIWNFVPKAKPRSHVRILIYRTWAILYFLFKLLRSFAIFIQMNFPRINHSLRCLPTPTLWSERSVQTSERCSFAHENDSLRKNCRFFDKSCSSTHVSLQSLSRWNIRIQASWPKQSCEYDGRFSWSNNAKGLHDVNHPRKLLRSLYPLDLHRVFKQGEIRLKWVFIGSPNAYP